eukprot:362118-Chlamydomonas_euryale.AAC.3
MSDETRTRGGGAFVGFNIMLHDMAPDAAWHDMPWHDVARHAGWHGMAWHAARYGAVWSMKRRVGVLVRQPDFGLEMA